MKKFRLLRELLYNARVMVEKTKNVIQGDEASETAGQNSFPDHIDDDPDLRAAIDAVIRAQANYSNTSSDHLPIYSQRNLLGNKSND